MQSDFYPRGFGSFKKGNFVSVGITGTNTFEFTIIKGFGIVDRVRITKKQGEELAKYILEKIEEDEHASVKRLD